MQQLNIKFLFQKRVFRDDNRRHQGCRDDKPVANSRAHVIFKEYNDKVEVEINERIRKDTVLGHDIEHNFKHFLWSTVGLDVPPIVRLRYFLKTLYFFHATALIP